MLKMNRYPACISKHSLNHENQIIFLIIPNRKGWNDLAVKNLFLSFRRITSKHDCNFYCLTKRKLEIHKKVCENKDCSGVVMASEDTRY